MLRRWGIHVVAFGPSIHDDDHAFLIRFFDSPEQRDAQLGRFYGGDEWRSSYDDRVTAMIESYHVVVVTAARELATGLAALGEPEPPG